mgnify:CR=1 FL=1
MKRFLKADDVLSQAKGNWVNILAQICGQELGTAVDNFSGKYTKSSRYFCPVHGGKSGEAFTLFKDADESGGGVCNSCGDFPDGVKLIMWIKGWEFRPTLEAIADALNIDNSSGSLPVMERKKYVPKGPTEKELNDAKRLISKRDQIISGCVPLNHSSALPARRYFARRGLTKLGMLGGQVLFHASLESWVEVKTKNSIEWKSEGYYPAIVSIVRNSNGEVLNIHRTFITEDGYKAGIESPRKMGASIVTCPINGGSIQLTPHARIMGVAEGLETALACREAMELAMHCTGNANLMRSWQPPVGCEIVIIFADNDKSQTGILAAQDLYERLTKLGMTVFIALPLEEDGLENVDWADVLEIHGVEGFPELPELPEVA